MRKSKIPRVRLCGAYTITHVASGGVYIGSTGDLRLRKLQHLWTLRRNQHRNPGLQNAFNSDPHLEFFVAITDTRGEAYDYEQQMLDHHKGNPLLFNVAMDARNPGIATEEFITAGQQWWIGKTHSQKSRDKMSRSRTGLTASDATKRKMSLAKKGKPNPVGENNVRQASLKRRRPVMAEGKRFESVIDSCRAFGLNISTALNRLNHKTKYQDWYFINTEERN